MSGYASEAQREAIEAAAGLPFLQKPIDVRTLRTIVGRATTPPGETGTGTPGA